MAAGGRRRLRYGGGNWRGEREGYVVHYAQGAWLAENGDLAVCLLGLAPDRSDAQFSIMVPARDMVGPGDGDSISGYLVPPGSIVSPCGPPPQGARAIPIEFVAAVGDSDPEGELYQGQDWEQDSGQDQDQDLVTLPGYLDQDISGAMVYVFDEPQTEFGATVIYRHESALQGAAEFTRLDIPVKETFPNAALGLLVPMALVVDIFIIYLCVEYPGGCT